MVALGATVVVVDVVDVVDDVLVVVDVDVVEVVVVVGVVSSEIAAVVMSPTITSPAAPAIVP